MINPAKPGEFVRFGVFQVDSSSGELRKNGIKIRLPDQSFQILLMLTESPGKVVTREELRNKLWPADTFVDFDNGLNSAILRLRNALGDSAEHPRYIETLPRRGYRFLGSVEPEESAVVVGAPPSEQAASRATPGIRRSLWVVSAAAGLALAVSLAWTVATHRAHSGTAAASAAIHSIAVLPLENLTGDPSQEYFADGMTDALITDLAQVQALRVTSRTSTMQYKGSKKRLLQIAHELNVDAVVEGTVVRSGERVRIDAQLVQANTDRHLWAKSYERDLRDVVALQGEVARAIADEIHVEVTTEERARLGAALPVNAEAYQAYLKGRFLWNERTDRSVTKGVEFFEQAIKKDPRYAPAYSGLADSYELLGFFGVLPPREAYPRAQAAAKKALELDPLLAEAHVSLGDTKFSFDWDWPGAEAELKRAIELNPKYDTAYRKYGNFLAGMGRTEESIAAANKALELDPLSITLSTHLGWMFYLARQNDLAVQQYEKTLEVSPNYARARRDFSLALVEKGRYEDAIREARRGIELSQPSPLMLEAVGYAYARAGKKDEARNVLHDLREMSRNRYVSSFAMAVIYAGLGEKHAAFSFLDKAYQEHAGQLIWLNAYPALDSLHSDARFAELVNRLGLPRTHPKAASGP
jgi:TolB-like protein/DNA-binding winged helix-turn-helix (wHTH) protein/Tfp pilus assembly protein PilF